MYGARASGCITLREFVGDLVIREEWDVFYYTWKYWMEKKL